MPVPVLWCGVEVSTLIGVESISTFPSQYFRTSSCPIFPIIPSLHLHACHPVLGFFDAYPAGGYGAGLLKVFLSSPVRMVTCPIGLPRMMWAWWMLAIPNFITKLWAAGDSRRLFCEFLRGGGGLEGVIVLKPPKTICLSVNN